MQIGNTTQRWLSELERGKPRAELELALRVLRELGFTLESAGNTEQRPPPVPDTSFDPADLVGMPRRTHDE